MCGRFFLSEVVFCIRCKTCIKISIKINNLLYIFKNFTTEKYMLVNERFSSFFFRALVPFFFTCSVIYMTLLIIKRFFGTAQYTHRFIDTKGFCLNIWHLSLHHIVLCVFQSKLHVYATFIFVGWKLSSKYTCIWFKAWTKDVLWLPPITFEYFDVNFLQFQIDSNFAQVILYSFFISLQIFICIIHCNITHCWCNAYYNILIIITHVSYDRTWRNCALLCYLLYLSLLLHTYMYSISKNIL